MLWRKGKAHGQDLRDRVFAAADGGSGVCEIARRLFVSVSYVSYVSKVLARRRQSGETAARPQRCHVPAKLAAYRDRIAERVAAFPDATLEELKTWLLAAYGVQASTTLIWETLDRLDLTFKKRARVAGPPVASETGRANLRRRGAAERFLVDLTP
jgi:transposase